MNIKTIKTLWRFSPFQIYINNSNSLPVKDLLLSVDFEQAACDSQFKLNDEDRKRNK